MMGFFSSLNKTQQVEPEPSHPDILIGMIGQSNQDGRGELSDLPSYLQNPITGADVWTGSSWSAIQAGVNCSTQLLVGPVFELVYRLVEEFPNRRIRVVHVAKGGTELNPDPNDDWDPVTGEMYAQFISDYNAAKASLNNYVELAIFWHQGEADSVNLTYANNYEQNEIDLINALKNDTGISKFVSAKIYDSLPAGTYPYVSTVNLAKETNLNNGHTDYLSDTSQFTYKADGIHLDTNGAISLGNDWYTYIRNFIN